MNNFCLGKDLYVKGRIGWRGLSKDEYLSSSNYRIINATALMDGYINWDNCGFISKERYEESSEIVLQENDILISKDGTLGKIGYVKNLKFPCTVASGIFVVRNTIKNILDSDYLYHLLKSDLFKDFIKRNKAEGSTINHLYQRDLNKFAITIPSIEYQRKVANILNGIDNLIKNNIILNNSILDYINECYDYLFYNLEDKTVNDNLTFSHELNRSIPKSWKVCKIDEALSKISKTYQYKTDEYLISGNYPIVDQSKKFICGYCNEKNNLINLKDCIVFGDHTREIKYINFSFARGADGTKILNSKIERLPNYLLYLQIKDMNINNQGYSRYYKYLKEKYIFIPDEVTCQKFKELLVPQLEVIKNGIFENDYLENLKRFLLPLLINEMVK